jgi:WD40 repeat protein
MGGINSIALSLDQTQIISMGQEKKISFWELQNSTPVHSEFVDGEIEEGLCLVRSHDGGSLVSGGSTGKVRLLLAQVVAHSGHVTGVAFSLDDRQVVSTGADGAIAIWCVFQ